MISYRSVLAPLILILWVEVHCKEDAAKTGYIPQFLCDYERAQIEQQTACILAILPSNITEVLTEKIMKLLKGKDMYDFLQDLCKKAPKLVLHAKRGLLQAVPKSDRPLLSALYDACGNATMYFMPVTPKRLTGDIIEVVLHLIPTESLAIE